jgi:protein NrfD
VNLFVANPHWGWWIILYFFLGGIAAGAYVLATLIELAGREEDRVVARIGYRIALPLILVCAVLLIVDLNQPSRFWHMLLKSEVVATGLDQGWPITAAGWRTMFGAPLFKYWSPMSIGSWALSLFGLCSFISFVATVRPQGFVARWHSAPWFGHPLRLIGCAVGFFVAAYTGTLLTATNQPIWSDSVWIASLFLVSAASTGSAALVLLGLRATAPATQRRLHRAELWLLGLELLVFLAFLASLGSLLSPLLGSVSGKVLLAGTLGVGLLIPLAIHMLVHVADKRIVIAAAACVLVGGFALRWGLLSLPPELLSRGSSTVVDVDSLINFGPEAGRPRGGGDGADPQNRPRELQPRSKVFSAQ